MRWSSRGRIGELAQLIRIGQFLQDQGVEQDAEVTRIVAEPHRTGVPGLTADLQERWA